MRAFKILLVVLVMAPILMGGHCQVKPPPIVIEPDDTADCGAACDHLRALGCPEGMPLMDGTSCVDFCIQTQKDGFALAPSCVVTIKTCDELESKCAKPRYHQDP